MTMPWTGYLRERFDADMERLLPDAYLPPVREQARPVEPYLAGLPAADADALTRWDRLARDGRLAELFWYEPAQYGFDFVAHGVRVRDKDGEDVSGTLWMLGVDPGGNGYVLVPSGEVRAFNHDEGALDPTIRFPSLDCLAWTLVHLEAVNSGTLALDEATAMLDGVDVGGCRYLLDTLRESLEEDDEDED